MSKYDQLKNKNLFIDIDGTLAVFKKVSVDELYERGYFLKLDPIHDSISAFKKLATYTENIYILSSYFADSQYALKEKREWVERYLPGAKCIFVPCGISKASVVKDIAGRDLTEDDILIDDYSENLLDWQSYGGCAVKFLNGDNGNGKKWLGKRVSGEFSSYILNECTA